MTENEELRQEIERLALERDQLRETVESQKALGLNLRQWFASHAGNPPAWWMAIDHNMDQHEAIYWKWVHYYTDEMCGRFPADHIAEPRKMVSADHTGESTEMMRTPGGASIASEPDPATLPRCSKCNRLGAKSIEGRMLCVTCYHEELL